MGTSKPTRSTHELLIHRHRNKRHISHLPRSQMPLNRRRNLSLSIKTNLPLLYRVLTPLSLSSDIPTSLGLHFSISTQLDRPVRQRHLHRRTSLTSNIDTRTPLNPLRLMTRILPTSHHMRRHTHSARNLKINTITHFNTTTNLIAHIKKRPTQLRSTLTINPHPTTDRAKRLPRCHRRIQRRSNMNNLPLLRRMQHPPISTHTLHIPISQLLLAPKRRTRIRHKITHRNSTSHPRRQHANRNHRNNPQN